MYYILTNGEIVGKSTWRISSAVFEEVVYLDGTDYKIGGTIIDGVYTPPVTGDETDEGAE